jgi:hypothetical protein
MGAAKVNQKFMLKNFLIILLHFVQLPKHLTLIVQIPIHINRGLCDN